MSIAGIDAPVGELAVEHELHVAGALELLEDHLVHARAGLDQRRGDDRERAAAVDVARGAEELLRLLQRLRVDAARHDLAAAAAITVLCARARRVIESSRMTTSLPVLDQPLRLLDHHVGDLDVARRLLVEGRGITSRVDVRAACR